MTKDELIKLVAKETKLSKKTAADVVDSTFENLAKAIKKDERIQVTGFGTFSVRSRKARSGRNPQTGAVINIKDSRTVGFKPARSLKRIEPDDVLTGLSRFYLP